jgi:hypothetical protein
MITDRQGQSSTVRKGLHILGREIDATGSYPCALAETIFFSGSSGFRIRSNKSPGHFTCRQIPGSASSVFLGFKENNLQTL